MADLDLAELRDLLAKAKDCEPGYITMRHDLVARLLVHADALIDAAEAVERARALADEWYALQIPGCPDDLVAALAPRGTDDSIPDPEEQP